MHALGAAEQTERVIFFTTPMRPAAASPVCRPPTVGNCQVTVHHFSIEKQACVTISRQFQRTRWFMERAYAFLIINDYVHRQSLALLAALSANIHLHNGNKRSYIELSDGYKRRKRSRYGRACNSQVLLCYGSFSYFVHIL